MAERETRRQRQERIKREGTLHQQVRGHQRWHRMAVTTGVALLVAIGVVGGGVIYNHIDQSTSYTITAVEGIPLIQKALETEGAAYDPQEKDSWDKAEQAKQKLPTDSIQKTVDTRLDLLRETMHASKNPYFSSTAQYFDDLIARGTLYPKILTDAPSHSTVATTGIEISNKQLILSLDISVPGIINNPLWETAIYFVHERKHMEDFLAIDSQNLNLSDDERRRVFKNLMGTRERKLSVEVPAYAEQIKAFLRFSALVGLDTNNTSLLSMTAQYLKAGRDYKNPKFFAYLVERGLVN